MGWPKGVPRKVREIVEQDNSPIVEPVASESKQFTEKTDDGGLIQNAQHHQAFNARQRENLEAKFEQEYLGVVPEEKFKDSGSQETSRETPLSAEGQIEDQPLRPTVVVKEQHEEPVRSAESKPSETVEPVSPSSKPQVTESEEYKAAVKRMHEATREAAETRKQLKQALDMMAQIKGSTVSPGSPEQELQPQSLTAEKKLEMLQSDPIGYMDRMERDAIEKAEKAVFGKLEERSKESVQKQQLNNFVSALDQRFREKHKDLSDPLFAPYIEKASQNFALTQEGAVTLVTRPEEFIDYVASQVRPIVETLKSKFTPADDGAPKNINAPEQQFSQDKRERIPASPIVKPSSSLAVPAGPKEDAGQTPQDYASSRRLQQKRIFGQVTA
jgi:hypothetical protein